MIRPRMTTAMKIWGQFIDVLRAAFTHADPKSAKNTVNPSAFFVLLGSELVKALHKMLVNSTPLIIFINYSYLMKTVQKTHHRRIIHTLLFKIHMVSRKQLVWNNFYQFMITVIKTH
jgi:hypothetical protein